MAKVVGISGAQGSGKTTLLEALKPEGFKVDDFKVSREVQKQLGWEKLDRVLENVWSMVEFQEEVLRQKIRRDASLRDGDGIIFTERTFADIAAYTTFWCWEHVDRKGWALDDAAKWLSGFRKECVKAQGEIYSAVVLIPLMPHVVWEEDANRANRASAETIFEDILRFSEHRQLMTLKTLRLQEKSVEERKNKVITFLESI